MASSLVSHLAVVPPDPDPPDLRSSSELSTVAPTESSVASLGIRQIHPSIDSLSGVHSRFSIAAVASASDFTPKSWSDLVVSHHFAGFRRRSLRHRSSGVFCCQKLRESQVCCTLLPIVGFVVFLALTGSPSALLGLFPSFAPPSSHRLCDPHAAFPPRRSPPARSRSVSLRSLPPYRCSFAFTDYLIVPFPVRRSRWFPLGSSASRSYSALGSVPLARCVPPNKGLSFLGLVPLQGPSSRHRAVVVSTSSKS